MLARLRGPAGHPRDRNDVALGSAVRRLRAILPESGSDLTLPAPAGPLLWTASHPSRRLPQSVLRMGPELDSATLRTSAALSGYAYAYRYAWRFS